MKCRVIWRKGKAMTDDQWEGKMTDLKPCPFCGGAAAVRCDGGHFVLCTTPNCIVHGSHWTYPEHAIEAWNTRPVEDKLNAEVERLRRGLGNIEVRTDVVGTEEEYDHEDMLHDIDRM